MKPRVFISYSRADSRTDHLMALKNLIEQTYDNVHGQRLSTYFDANAQEIGPLAKEIRAQIDSCDVFFAFISDNYSNPSGTAYAEWQHALNVRHGRKNFVIVPLIYRKLQSGSFFWKKAQEFITFDLTDSFISDERGRIEKEILRLVRSLRDIGASTQRHLNDTPTQADVKTMIDELGNLVQNLPAGQVFQYPLILNILRDVRDEIKSVPSSSYYQDISLARSFVVRASAIFTPATHVYAVSLDRSSSFWLSENTKKLAYEYTLAQPPTTIRLFVFSDPMAMLAHRWVLCEHFKRYGASGRVLMTSLKNWEAYLSERFRDEQRLPTLSEDFGILKYALRDNPIIARLSRESLSFEESKAPEFCERIIEDFSKPHDVTKHNDGESHVVSPLERRRRFWLWREPYENVNDSKAWLRCVSDVFDEDVDFTPTYNSMVMHIVLFAPDPERRTSARSGKKDAAFQEFMKQVINDLVELKSSRGELLVQSIWFGRTVPESDIEANDPIHQNRVLVDLSGWDYCLNISFRNQDELREFYEHEKHGEIRQRVYEFLDPNMRVLYAAIGKSNNRNENIGEAIERIVRKYMLRMDYIVPNPYVVYEAISAPNFAPKP